MAQRVWIVCTGIDTIPYDTRLEAPVRMCLLLVVPEVPKRH